MSIGMAFIMASGGLTLLAVGGEFLLRGAVGIARNLGLSPMLIGLSIVAAATSMPELMVTVTAGLREAPDVGVGNVIGSNIANILLILGVGALINPVRTCPNEIGRDSIAMLLASFLFIVLAHLGVIGVLEGLIMLALLVGYIAFSYYEEVKSNNPECQKKVEEEIAETAVSSLPFAAISVVLGMLALVFGSDFLIEGALVLARAAGVSETVIGLTLVAFGTSLPELATVIAAGIRGRNDLALGNVLGSNLFNVLMILGLLGIISPFAVPQNVLDFDIWAMLASSLLVLPMMFWGGKICRTRGIFFIALYGVYVLYQFKDKLNLTG